METVRGAGERGQRRAMRRPSGVLLHPPQGGRGEIPYGLSGVKRVAAIQPSVPSSRRQRIQVVLPVCCSSPRNWTSVPGARVRTGGEMVCGPDRKLTSVLAATRCVPCQLGVGGGGGGVGSAGVGVASDVARATAVGVASPASAAPLGMKSLR